MKVLLVGPDFQENLSTRYLSASLVEAGHAVELTRFNERRDGPAVLDAARNADLIGLSMCFQARAAEFIELAEQLRARYPEVMIVGGGHYASCEATTLLEHHSAIDLIVIREGERSLVEIADLATRGRDFSSIHGIAHRDSAGRPVLTAARPAEDDLDELPFPDRRGQETRLAGIPTAYLMGSRGCLGDCGYCSITTLHKMSGGQRFRQRDPENIALEMAELYHQKGIRQFVFHDNNFLVPSAFRNHRRLDTLERAIVREGLTDIALVLKLRPGDADRDVLERLKRMGLIRVFLGIGSSTAAGLGFLNRRQSVAECKDALDLCQELGISAHYTLLVFHPETTVESLDADIAFMRQYNHFPLNFCCAEIYSGTPLLAALQAQGRARGNYLSWEYEISDPTVNLIRNVSKRLFYQRCWSTTGLVQLSIGMDHLSTLLSHFYSGSAVDRVCDEIDLFGHEVNTDTIELLDSLTTLCVRFDDPTAPAFLVRLRQLAEQESALRRRSMAVHGALRQRIEAIASHQEPRASSQRWTPRLHQTARVVAR